MGPFQPNSELEGEILLVAMALGAVWWIFKAGMKAARGTVDPSAEVFPPREVRPSETELSPGRADAPVAPQDPPEDR